MLNAYIVSTSLPYWLRLVISWKNSDCCSLLNSACRENCQCNECVHAETKQRMVDTFAVRCLLVVLALAYSRQIPGSVGPVDITYRGSSVEVHCMFLSSFFFFFNHSELQLTLFQGTMDMSASIRLHG